MGWPTTVAGIFGLIIFVIWMTGQVQNADKSQEIKALQDSMILSINQTQPSTLPVIGDAINTLDVIWNMFKLILAYLTNFIDISKQLPIEFTILFVLVILCLIIAIAKLVRGVGEES